MTAPSSASVRITSRGVHHTVEVDGRDISAGLRGVTARLDPDSLPVIELDLLVIELEDLAAEHAQLHIPTATVDALVALGWTPPPDVQEQRS